MSAVVDGGEGEVHFPSLFGGLSPNRLDDLGDHEGVQPGIGVVAVVLGTSDGNQNDVVLSSLLDGFHPGGVLDVGSGLAEFGLGADTVVFQNGFDLAHGGVEDSLLQLAYGVILENDVGVICG